MLPIAVSNESRETGPLDRLATCFVTPDGGSLWWEFVETLVMTDDAIRPALAMRVWMAVSTYRTDIGALQADIARAFIESDGLEELADMWHTILENFNVPAIELPIHLR